MYATFLPQSRWIYLLYNKAMLFYKADNIISFWVFFKKEEAGGQFRSCDGELRMSSPKAKVVRTHQKPKRELKIE